jgi:hypothetical protein
VRLKAKHLIKTGAGYVRPGETFDVPDGSAARLIRLGAAEAVPTPAKAPAAVPATPKSLPAPAGGDEGAGNRAVPSLTVAQLTAAILAIDPQAAVKGLKKADLERFYADLRAGG